MVRKTNALIAVLLAGTAKPALAGNNDAAVPALAGDANAGENQVLLIADLVAGGTPTRIMSVSPADGLISDCRWATDTRLACNINYVAEATGKLIGYSRLFAIGSDGSQVVKLTRETGGRSVGDIFKAGSDL